MDTKLQKRVILTSFIYNKAIGVLLKVEGLVKDRIGLISTLISFILAETN